MSFLAKVEYCNRRELTHYLPFVVDGVQVGWLTSERAAALKTFSQVFVAAGAGVTFHGALTSARARSDAVAAIASDLTATKLFPKLRNELYAVKNQWCDAETFRLDRGLVVGFGVRAYGVHINGVVRKAPSHGTSGLHLWVGTRAMDCRVEPGKLDNMVAGGQPAGLSLRDNLIKECGEEAHIDAILAQTARSTGLIAYAFTSPEGLKQDTLFCYDIEMPEAVIPQPSEEISRYELMPIEEILKLIADSDRFKFNVGLVILDCAIRHGVLTPETTSDFEAIIRGLHAQPQLLV